ncbi:T9SS type A sorting domain-containing protein [Flavivirga abyssicola]|uniref:T9SS type A sorting domain-containing protein n=1 Tax=Flavivirga abyssicola TaxID=3063533 RepID=UPI0026DFC2D5|nr:T9SS type A sorting domain-containing protein [Flavivirga sp. MEBiC07777]WVK13778.1 T9SS type A sorting domain-containing protein [Flavivirga sp. MEBiC07777]
MKTQLLKNLTLVLALVVSMSMSAQQNFDFTALDCNASKYTATEATLTCDNTGFTLTPSGSKSFFEFRISNTKTDGQNRVIINYTNNSNADGIFFRAGGGVDLQGATVVDLGPSSVVYEFSDPGFTDPDGGGGATGGKIQLRSRFVNKAGDPIVGNVLITSLEVDNQGTLSLDDVFAKANTIVTVKNREIVVKNTPENSKIEVYNMIGQSVDKANLASGIYVVKVSADRATLTKKVLVQ